MSKETELEIRNALAPLPRVEVVCQQAFTLSLIFYLLLVHSVWGLEFYFCFVLFTSFKQLSYPRQMWYPTYYSGFALLTSHKIPFQMSLMRVYGP